MGRLIDTDEYEKRIKPYDTADVMDKALYNFAHNNLITTPTAQQWIPCSERLPEPRIDVWCNSDMGQMVGYYEENVETWYGRNYLELMVTAWMPLPEPFKAERWEDWKTT